MSDLPATSSCRTWNLAALGAGLGVAGAVVGSVLVGVLLLILGTLGHEPNPEMPLWGIVILVMGAGFLFSVGPAASIGALAAVVLYQLQKRVRVRVCMVVGFGAVAGLLAGFLVLALVNYIYGGEPIAIVDWAPILGLSILIGTLHSLVLWRQIQFR